MKFNPIFFVVAAFFFLGSCNTKPQPKNKQAAKTENDSIEVVYKPYSGTTDLTEYEIPIRKGTKVKHGIQKRFYRNGSLYSEIPYKNGKRVGTAYTYYPAAPGVKPAVWKEQNYVENKLNGICKRYHDDGTLQAEYEYKNGNPAVGLKEYSKSGKAIKQPTLIISSNRTARGYYVSIRLSNKQKNVDYFIGNLVDGKYLPKGLKKLQVKNGLGEVMVDNSTKNVTLTAVFATRYRNKCIISKTISLQ